MSDKPVKMILINSCEDCPFHGKCQAWRDLTPTQRITLTIGKGVGKFILAKCKLEDYSDTTKEES